MNLPNPIVSIIIPAHNEAGNIAQVLKAIPSLVTEVVVVNNNSTDRTEEVALRAGATVLSEKNKGYGYACLKGIAYLSNKEEIPDIVVFLDGDYSDYPEEMPLLVNPIIAGEADFVVGARIKKYREAGAMTFPQRFGNNLATSLMRWMFGARFTDLGPFRAIRFDVLQSLKMEDKTYGWTVEMQLKAVRQKVRYLEVPVHYRNRNAGTSKVSGTLKGAIFAGVKILGWIFKYSVKK
jgi:glycosyltransferase involved in cell wall biosynthesis